LTTTFKDAAMLDEFPQTTDAPAQSDPRLLALRFLSRSGARLARAAARIGDEAGVALVQVLRDMVIDFTVDPMHWPIDETLAMLRRPGARADAHVDRLIEGLSLLRDRIEARAA
jgi:hypothetical protein